MNIENIYENSKKNSIGKDKKQKLVKKIKKISTAALVSFIAITSGVSLTACQDPNYTTQMVSLYIYDAQEIFEKYGLDYSQKYSVEDYMKIPDINDENLIGFYEMRGREECEKIAQSIGYEGIDDYLVKNGYEKDNGEPSVRVWREYYANKALGGEKSK